MQLGPLNSAKLFTLLTEIKQELEKIREEQKMQKAMAKFTQNEQLGKLSNPTTDEAPKGKKTKRED